MSVGVRCPPDDMLTSLFNRLIIICGSLPPIRALFLTVKNNTKVSSASGPGGYHTSRCKPGTPGVEVLGLKNVSSQRWSEGWSKGAAGTSHSHESQEGILPQHSVGPHNACVGGTDGLPALHRDGIMVQREYNVDVGPRVL